jgi:hypothetical protein
MLVTTQLNKTYETIGMIAIRRIDMQDERFAQGLDEAAVAASLFSAGNAVASLHLSHALGTDQSQSGWIIPKELLLRLYDIRFCNNHNLDGWKDKSCCLL